METVHVSMASGGAYLGLHTSFWAHLERLPGGIAFRKSVTSYSGSSAGALAAVPLSRGIAGSAIMHNVASGGLGRFKTLRAIAVFLRLKKSMYSGTAYAARLLRLCDTQTTFRSVPVSVAVTNQRFEQRCLRYNGFSTISRVVNAAVASAAIPFVFPAVDVSPEGKCVDGSVSRASFPESTIRQLFCNATGTVVLLNCVPWPGFHNTPTRQGLTARLRNRYADSLYDHGMEGLTRNLHGFQYKDGIFDVHLDNSSGQPRLSDAGELRVIFVAPTSAQWDRCGGNDGIAMFDYTRSSAFIRKVTEQGRLMAREFAIRYCSMSL